jgi:hypothetical protein
MFLGEKDVLAAEPLRVRWAAGQSSRRSDLFAGR